MKTTNIVKILAALSLALTFGADAQVIRASNTAPTLQLGSSSSDTVNVYAGTLRMNNSLVANRDVGTAATGTAVIEQWNRTFTGNADGTSDIRGRVDQLQMNGANSAAQAINRNIQTEIRNTPGSTLTFAYGEQAFVRLGRLGSSTGNITTARGYEYHFANEGTGTVGGAISFYAQDVDLLDGTGTIGDVTGFLSGNLGHATRVTSSAVGFDAGDMTAGAPLTVAFRSKMASGANKWAFYAQNSAPSAFNGKVRVGSVVAPTVELDVTGAAAISGNATISGTATVVGTLAMTDPTISTITSTGPLKHIAKGAEQFRVDGPSTAVNRIQIEGGVAGGQAVIRSGGETNAAMHIYTAGNGALYLGAQDGAAPQVKVQPAASANRQITLSGSNGADPAIGTTAGNLAVTSNVIGSGSILTSSTAGIGYAAGAGGTVVQATSKSTGVTLNKASGQITMNGAALAAGAKVSFVVTNSQVAAADTPIVAVASGGTANAYRAAATAVAVGGGSFTITVENITAGSLSEAPVITFNIVKGATT